MGIYKGQQFNPTPTLASSKISLGPSEMPLFLNSLGGQPLCQVMANEGLGWDPPEATSKKSPWILKVDRVFWHKKSNMIND